MRIKIFYNTSNHYLKYATQHSLKYCIWLNEENSSATYISEELAISGFWNFWRKLRLRVGETAVCLIQYFQFCQLFVVQNNNFNSLNFKTFTNKGFSHSLAVNEIWNIVNYLKNANIS